MKSKLSIAALAAAMVLCVSSAQAITLTDSDAYSGIGTSGLIDSTHFVSGTLNLDSSGYSLVPDSGLLKFTFGNNLDLDAVDILVNASLLGNGIIPTSITIPLLGTFNIASQFGSVTAWVVNYQITLDQSNPNASIYLTKAEYSADVTANTPDVSSVPDGGTTLSLLGLALTGLGLARRQFRA